MKKTTKPTKTAPPVEQPQEVTTTIVTEPKTTDEVSIAIRVPMDGGAFVAESKFSREFWKAAKTEPSAAQYIIGVLLRAMEAEGYKEP